MDNNILIHAAEMDGQTVFPEFEEQEQPASAADKIRHDVLRVAFVLDLMKDPEDALYNFDASPELLQKFSYKRFLSFCSIVAAKTGADVKEIINKETRTPEQQQLLIDSYAEDTVKRMDAFLASRYIQALDVLEPLQGLYNDPAEDADDPSSLSVKMQAAMYFFAKYGSDPTASDALTQEDIDTLKDVFRRLDAFYVQRSAEVDGEYILSSDQLYDFIGLENPKPETAESIVTILESFSPISHAMPNNPLQNTLQQKAAINAGPFDMVVSNAKGRRKEITAYTMITYDPGDTGIEITDAKLSEYERQVSDSVISLWIEATENGKTPIFSVDQIFRAMPGGSDKPSRGQKGAITKTLEKFARLHIYMDATEEMQRRGLISADKKWIVDEDYLHWRRHTVMTKHGKKEAQGYEILGQPIMLTYSKLTKQLLTVPAKNIAIEKVSKNGKPSGELIPMSPERQAMTGYLVRMLAIMKYDTEKAKDAKRKYDAKRKKDTSLPEKPLSAFKSRQNTILFDTLFQDTGTASANRDRTMDNRNFCFDVLDYQKAIGYIKGYEKIKKGRSIAGIRIMF